MDAPRPQRRQRVWWIVPPAVAVAAAVAWLAAAGVIGPARLATGPLVQSVTEAGFSLAWSCSGWGDTQALVVAADGVIVAPAESARLPGGRRECRFDKLPPGREHRYQIASGQRVLAEHVARIAPPRGASFRVLAFGDSGSGNEFQFRLAARMREVKADLVVHTGDLIYKEGQPGEYPGKFYQPYAELIAAIPFYPCIGNHDYDAERGQPMLDNFVLPRNGPAGDTPERHYWFDYGDVRFVALDSDLPHQHLRDVVAPWLETVLDAAGDRWKIVFFHHPVYTDGKYAPAYRIRHSIVPVLERHDVHLVLNGHDHLYQRYRPIRSDAVVPEGEGVVYVTTGAGGGDLYEPRSDLGDELAVQYAAKHSFTVIDVSRERLALRQVDIDGAVVDEYDLWRRGAGSRSSAADHTDEPR